MGGEKGGRQENRTPERLLLHLPRLRFVPEDPRGRCPGPSGRGAAQVRKLGLPDSPVWVISLHRTGRSWEGREGRNSGRGEKSPGPGALEG